MGLATSRSSHIADLPAQLVPVYFREAAVNIGVGEARGQVAAFDRRALLERYGIPPASAAAYGSSPDDFTALAKAYAGWAGSTASATVLEAIRAERGEKVVFLDGGDTWQNSYTSLVTKGRTWSIAWPCSAPTPWGGIGNSRSWPTDQGTDAVAELPVPRAQCARTPSGTSRCFRPATMLVRGGVQDRGAGTSLTPTLRSLIRAG